MLLTGTPLQNTVEELFSLLHFLEPGRFPSETTFMQEFGDLKTEEQVKLSCTLTFPFRYCVFTRSVVAELHYLVLHVIPVCFWESLSNLIPVSLFILILLPFFDFDQKLI